MAPSTQDSSLARRIFRRLLRLVGSSLLMVLLCLAAVEITLRIFSGRIGPRPVVASAERAGRRILCIGDSWTYGVGAPPGQSYPDDLQRELGDGYSVFNEGWPGANSSVTANRLPELLDKYRPSTVLVLIGMNNRHNPLGGTYAELARAGYLKPSAAENLMYTLDEFAWHFATWRLLRWSIASVEDPWRSVEALNVRAEPSADDRQSQPMTQLPPAMREAFLAAGMAAASGDMAGTVAQLRTAFGLMTSCSQMSGVNINQLLDVADRASRADVESLMRVLRERLSPDDYAVCAQGPLLLRDRADVVAKVLWYDLARMARTCAARSVQLVVMSYPTGGFESVVHPFSALHGVPFIETSDFAQYTRPGPLESEHHLSAVGYEGLAKTIARQGRTLGVFPMAGESNGPR